MKGASKEKAAPRAAHSGHFPLPVPAMSFLRGGVEGKGGWSFISSQSSSTVFTPPRGDWRTREGGLHSDSMGNFIGKGQFYKEKEAKDAEAKLSASRFILRNPLSHFM